MVVLVAQMTQMEADALLDEHRAVMAALIKNEIRRPTPDQYEAQLDLLRKEMGKCVIFTSDLPSHLSARF
jgi:hypothetical protein